MTDGPQYPAYPGDQPDQPLSAPPTLPPPPGYSAPPPGYHPPPVGGDPVQPQYHQPIYTPPAPYASWWSRVGASLIDSLIAFVILLVPVGVGLFLAFRNVETDPVSDEITGGVAVGGILLALGGFVLYLAFDIWNRVFRMGRTGQSIGRKAVGIRVAAISHGGPIGPGAAFGRWAISMVAGFVLSCLVLIDVLWPLWDDKKQTLHDKVVGSVVLRARS